MTSVFIDVYKRQGAVMKALSERHSTREYASKALSLADLSDLLWAANGINRKAVSYTHLVDTVQLQI